MLNKEKPVLLTVDKDKCKKCGVCIEVCPSYLKKDENNFPIIDPEGNDFGCIQCGYCMMICPNNAIEIVGEDIDKEHLRELSPNTADFEALNALFLKRRSCRKFKEEEVSKETINSILQAAATAAVSIPPSEVKVIVIQGRSKVQEFADELIDGIKNFKKTMNPLMLGLLRLIAGKAKYKVFKDFILPLCKIVLDDKKKGYDHLFYNAPAVIIFYGTELTDKEDMLLAANQATLAAESIGLGTCYIGMVAPMVQNNPKLRKKYGILKGEKLGAAFILGYPVMKFRRAFQRNFKEVRFVE